MPAIVLFCPELTAAFNRAKGQLNYRKITRGRPPDDLIEWGEAKDASLFPRDPEAVK
jgi:hypothetical protein